jgi:hypothetical protein
MTGSQESYTSVPVISALNSMVPPFLKLSKREFYSAVPLFKVSVPPNFATCIYL